MTDIILASKSKVRKEILDNHNIDSKVEASNVDEDPIKESSHLRILYGNLAPEGAVAKITGQEGTIFEGKARVFNSEEDIIIGNLQMPNYNNRKNDIFKLFVNFKIGICIYVNRVITYMHQNDRSSLDYQQQY